MTNGGGATRKIPFNTLEPGFRAHAREYEEAALRVLRSGWYVLGEEVAAFEREYAAFLGVPHCVGLNSGLDALALAVCHVWRGGAASRIDAAVAAAKTRRG